MDHLDVASEQATTVDNCRAIIVFLRESMCCGEAGKTVDLGPVALSGLGYIFQIVEDQLDQASKISLEVVRSLCKIENSSIKSSDRTKAAA
jgi:hypothetical protein